MALIYGLSLSGLVHHVGKEMCCVFWSSYVYFLFAAMTLSCWYREFLGMDLSHIGVSWGS